MKIRNAKLPAFLIALFFSTFNVLAQPCTPDTNYTAPGTYPDTLPWSQPDVPYIAVIDFKVPTDSTLGPITATIDSLKIIDVIGLPAGFSYDCNVPGCAFLGGDNGCAALTGTPDSAMLGSHPLLVIVKTFMRISTTPAEQTDTTENYIIHVYDPADTTSDLPGIKEAVQNKVTVKILPHPVVSGAFFSVKNAPHQTTSLQLFDLTGKALAIQPEPVSGGFYLQNEGLPPGLYFYRLQQNDRIITAGKVLIAQ